LPGHGLSSVELEAALHECDLAAIVTAHPDVDYEAVVAAAPLTVDFRGVTRKIDSENLIRL
jgi:UDP-N-acetyl-D-mannosaminuronate dehydrogenase